MLNDKRVNFAEFLMNALDINFESIECSDELIDVKVDENVNIILTVCEYFKTVLHFQIFPKNEPAVYKLKKMSISCLVRNANKIHSHLPPKVEVIDLSDCIAITD